MHLKPAVLLIFYGTVAAAAEETEASDEVDEIEAYSGEDLLIPLTRKTKPEDIDVLCSKLSANSTEPVWTWVDVSDVNVMGHWREYGICVDKSGDVRFRFRAFQLDHAHNYDTVRDRCLENGYDFAQPARLYPDKDVNSIGWPDRGYVGGPYGPSSFHLGSGRISAVREQERELASDGWYVFKIDEDLFTPGFVSVQPCRRIQMVSEVFELREISCQNYYKC